MPVLSSYALALAQRDWGFLYCVEQLYGCFKYYYTVFLLQMMYPKVTLKYFHTQLCYVVVFYVYELY